MHGVRISFAHLAVLEQLVRMRDEVRPVRIGESAAEGVVDPVCSCTTKDGEIGERGPMCVAGKVFRSAQPLRQPSYRDPKR